VQRQWYDGSKHGKVSKKAVDQHQFLAEQFEADRAHLRSVAYRMLGSISDADDAVQETWLRLSRADTSGVENLTGWLTTVVARVSLDMLRSRTSRREEQFGDSVPEPPASHAERVDPEHEAVLADSVGLALLVVLDTLGPAERLAFVLHDMFAVPFDEIASILGRSPAAAKQLASRARADVFRAPRQTPTSRPMSRASERWSMHSWPPPAVVTSTRCWRCSIRMLSCAQIARWSSGRERIYNRRCVERWRWLAHSPGVPRERRRP
jgi:RNA polymerase sigma factor (sigma-70 family)